ncbi:hypothetical protein HG531_004975 [Fusarium graminearum]|nr:hypothetical protein HG531_004975 [Fusarium graminearum]
MGSSKPKLLSALELLKSRSISLEIWLPYTKRVTRDEMLLGKLDTRLGEIPKHSIIISSSKTPDGKPSTTQPLKALLDIRSWLQGKVSLRDLLNIRRGCEAAGLFDTRQPEHAIEEGREELVKLDVTVRHAEVGILPLSRFYPEIDQEAWLDVFCSELFAELVL